MQQKKLAFDVSCFLLFIACWWLLSRDSENPFFPPLHDLLGDAWDYWWSDAGLRDLRATLTNIIGGLGIGIASGIALGLLMSQQRLAYLALMPAVELLRCMPNVILLPITISIFGIGQEMKIFNIALVVMWPVLVNTIDGYRSIPQQWLQTARVFSLSAGATRRNVIVPALLPRILTGIHIAIPLSLVIAVTSEMVGATTGIGSVILNAQYTFDVRRMWSGVLLLGLLGYLLNAGFSIARRQILQRLG